MITDEAHHYRPIDAEPDVKRARLDVGAVPCVHKVANAADPYVAVLQIQEHVPSPGAPAHIRVWEPRPQPRIGEVHRD